MIIDARSAVTTSPAQKEWYDHTIVPLFSRKQFFSWRYAWHSIVEPTRAEAESVADLKRRDYTAYWSAVAARRVAEDSGDAAAAVLDAMAAHYDVSPSSPEWIAATNDFRDLLGDAFEKVSATAPRSLLTTSPALLIRDCVPLWRQGGRVPQGEHSPFAIHLHRRQRDLVVEALRTDARRLSTVDADRRSAMAALATLLEAERAGFQERLLGDAPSDGGRPVAGLDPTEVGRLLSALDEYDDAVRRIVYPHLSDGALVRVRTRTTLRRAARVSKPPSANAMERLRSSISTAIDEDREAAMVWPAVRLKAQGCSPAGSLIDALTVAVDGSRRQEILGALPGDSVPTRVGHAVRHGLVGPLLDAMTRQEQDRLLIRLGHEDAAELSGVVVRSTILVALGLETEEETPGPFGISPADAARTLQRKIQRDEFDVFFAHHSTDRAAVLQICRTLRHNGIYPWVDVEQVQPGTWFQDAIQSAIRTVRSAAIVLGEDGLGPWQRLEVRTFVERCVMAGIPVVPVLLPGLSRIPDDLPFLRELHHVRFERTLVEEPALRQLVWGVTGVRPVDGL